MLWGEDFYIKSKFNQLRLNPGSKSVDFKSANKSWVSISEPGKVQKYKILKQSGNSIEWLYPKSGVKFAIKLANEKIEVNIHNPNSTKVIWPKIKQQPSFNALIWPYGQGLWIPFSNKKDFFNNNKIPDNGSKYWGVNFDNRTLTYIHSSSIELSHYTKKGLVRFDFTQNSNDTKISVIHSLSKSPIEPAIIYKKYLVKTGEYKPLKDKVNSNILGAPIFSLEGKEYITGNDLIGSKTIELCQTIIRESKVTSSPSFDIKRMLFGSKDWDLIFNYAQKRILSKSEISDIAKVFGKIIVSDKFYTGDVDENSAYLYNSFSEYLKHYQTWGSGRTLGVLNKLKQMKIDNSIILTNSHKNLSISNYAEELGYKTGLKDYIMIDQSEKSFKNTTVIPLRNALNRESFLMATDKTSTKEDIVQQLLYMQTPLYHVGEDWTFTRKIQSNFDIIKKLHEKYGSSKMKGFDYLTESGTIQRATYDGGLTAVANFSQMDCNYNNKLIPPGAILLTTPDDEIIY